MKDSLKAKIEEARAEGRDIPLVIEELLMHIAEGMDGEPAQKPYDPEKPAA